MVTMHQVNGDTRTGSSSVLSDYVREYPSTLLAAGAAAGFVVGGALATRMRRGALALTVRAALQVFEVRIISGVSHGESRRTCSYNLAIWN